MTLDIEEKNFKFYTGFCWTIVYTGIFVGYLLGMITVFYSFSDVALIILVVFPTAIFAVLHSKDTLPSKEEREWRKCIRHLFLILHKGICITHHPFREEKLIDDDLFAGGMSGAIGLIQEFTSSDDKIETFSQKDTKIIVQYGKYLTGALRFEPGIQLIKRHFT